MVAESGLVSLNATFLVELGIFLVTAVFLWKVLWGPLLQILQQREDKIEAGRRAAEEAEERLLQVQQDVARTLEEAKQQAREIIARAHSEALEEGEELRHRSHHDAELLLERARHEINAERQQAIKELRTEVGDLVVSAASQILGATIDDQVHQRLIEKSLGQIKIDAN